MISHHDGKGLVISE